MSLFWIQLVQSRTYLPWLFLSTHHPAITSHSFAGRRGCINNWSSTKAQNGGCRKAGAVCLGAPAQGWTRSTRGSRPLSRPGGSQEHLRQGSAGCGYSSCAELNKGLSENYFTKLKQALDNKFIHVSCFTCLKDWILSTSFTSKSISV